MNLQQLCDLVTRDAPIDEFFPAIHWMLSSNNEESQHAREIALDGLLTKFMKMDHIAIAEAQQLLRSEFPHVIEFEKICSCARSFANAEGTKGLDEWLEAAKWLIVNYPESIIHQSPALFHVESEIYHQLGQTWDIVIKEYSTNLKVLGNAATFFFLRDKEKCLNILQTALSLADDKSFWLARIDKLNLK